MAKLKEHLTRERHIRLGKYLKDVIFAANDGIVTTFAVVAGVVGASLSSAVVLIIGFASLIADGFSMATGNYLGTKSERDFYEKEKSIEISEIRNLLDREKEEIREILQKKGYREEELEQMVELIASNEDYFADFMMYEELGLSLPETNSPIKHALATFLSFIFAGSLPLLPYLVLETDQSFLAAAIFAGVALFVIGALRKFFSRRSWILSGLEMLLVGGSAAIVAYLIGFALRSIVA